MLDRVRVYIEAPAPLLTWTLRREMQERWWFSFGVYTMHHSDLGKLAAPIEVKREVGECRTVLEQQLGRPVHIFIYPFGQIGDHGLRAVKHASYNWTVNIMLNINTPRSDPYLLEHRIMSIDKYWLVVAAETTGVWQFFSRLMHFTASTVPTPSISKTTHSTIVAYTFISRSAQ